MIGKRGAKAGITSLRPPVWRVNRSVVTEASSGSHNRKPPIEEQPEAPWVGFEDGSVLNDRVARSEVMRGLQ